MIPTAWANFTFKKGVSAKHNTDPLEECEVLSKDKHKLIRDTLRRLECLPLLLPQLTILVQYVVT